MKVSCTSVVSDTVALHNSDPHVFWTTTSCRSVGVVSQLTVCEIVDCCFSRELQRRQLLYKERRRPISQISNLFFKIRLSLSSLSCVLERLWRERFHRVIESVLKFLSSCISDISLKKHRTFRAIP